MVSSEVFFEKKRPLAKNERPFRKTARFGIENYLLGVFAPAMFE
jgi:hypothetical protein